MLRLLLSVVVLTALTLAGVWSIRLAWADLLTRFETVPATEAALKIVPDQAQYYARLALLTPDSDEMTAIAALRRSAAINPSDAHTWIELGLRYEARGEIHLSEESLLRAAEEDKQYLPRWTLANFYFRHGNTTDFWRWSKSSAEMLYGDPRPLFRLCGQIEEDGNLIDRIDLSPALQAQYVGYLLERGLMNILKPGVERVIRNGRPVDTPLLMAVCDRLIDEHRAKEAIAIWNRLAESKRIPLDVINPAQPKLTNGHFAAEPSSHGFDWRVPDNPGVTVSKLPAGQGIRVTFSGRQPESCETLVQLVPVNENTRYKLKFSYRTSGIAAGSGLRWHVMDAVTTRTLSDGESLSSETETQQGLDFATPASTNTVRLALSYQRAIGTTRIEGFAVLSEVQLNRAN